MHPTIARMLFSACLLLLCAGACRDGYESTSGGYYYNGPAEKSYLELSDSLYRKCDVFIDGEHANLWTNRRTKVKPGTREVRCDPARGTTGFPSRTTVEFRPGKVLHLDTIW